VDDGQILRLMLTAGLSVAVFGGALAVALYSLAGRGRLFGPVGPIRFAPNGVAVAGAFAAFLLTGPIVLAGLEQAGFYRAVYGPDFPSGWPEKAAATVRYLWAATFALPIQVAVTVGLVRALGGRVVWAGPRWAPHLVAAYLTWLLVTPTAFSVYVLANLVHTRLTDQPPDKHPLTMLGDSAGTREWALFVLQTTVFAPVIEELLFRGVLLPWLGAKRPADPEAFLTVPPSRRPLAIMLLAAGVAVVLQTEEVRVAWAAGDHSRAAAHLIPGAFFLALVPLLFVVPHLDRLRRHVRLRSRRDVEAILASSALFAAVHAHVWPSPVPLFLLAIGLSYLYLRTRSLIGPIVVHGLFNSVSAVYLLLGGPA
jgi:membrane protease YdiL (CAAX protease family)